MIKKKSDKKSKHYIYDQPSLKNVQTTAVSMVCGEVIPFLGSSVHECGLAHSSFSSRKMKFSVVSQDLTTKVGS